MPRAWGRDPTALGNRVSKAHSEDVFDQMGQNDGTRMCLTRWGRTMTTKVVKTRFFSEPTAGKTDQFLARDCVKECQLVAEVSLPCRDTQPTNRAARGSGLVPVSPSLGAGIQNSAGQARKGLRIDGRSVLLAARLH